MGGGNPRVWGHWRPKFTSPRHEQQENSLRRAGRIGEDGAEYGKSSSLSNTNQENLGRISRDWRWRERERVCVCVCGSVKRKKKTKKERKR